MIANLKPYPKMKDSGVPWLGQVPEHWKVVRIREIADMRVSNVDKLTNDSELPVRLCNYVDVYKHDRIRNDMPFMRATATPEEIERFHLQEGDVLITKDSEAWDDIGVPALVDQTADDLICGYHLALLRPREGSVLGGYLFRAIQSAPVSLQFHLAANGVTRYGLTHSGIKSVSLPLPPLSEQSAIIRLLDQTDGLIGRYINAKQKLIQRLEELKQVIIHQAVTRGLDPNVPLKPSGVKWLGDIPAHWKTVRNGRLFAERDESGFTNLPILEVSLRTGVRIRSFDGTTRKQVMDDLGKYKRAARNDLTYNMMRMWQGAVGIAPVDGLVSPAYVVAKPVGKVEPRYYSALFRTVAYMNEVNRFSRGIVQDRNRLYWDDFRQIASPYPPADEQIAIANAIERETKKIDDVISLTQQIISGISEYFGSLVANITTGKLDVSSATQQLAAGCCNEFRGAP